MFQGFWEFYEKKYKKLIIVPLLVLVFFTSVILYTKLTTGEFFRKDISLKGGTSVTFYTSEISGVEEWLKQAWGEDTQLVIISNPIGGFKGYDFRVGRQLSISEVKEKLSELTGNVVTEDEFSMGFQGASIASSFFKDSLVIIAISFLLMGGVALYYFKSVIPAVSIAFSTIADVVVVIGMLNLLGEALSVASIGALLMLIGYSTDSDMLLAANIIKKKQGGLIKRLKKSFKTALTMSLAAITTSLVMYSLTSIDMIRSIALILLIGSISDMLNTWVLSAGLQRMYRERKSK
jgi:preprotein translocase subunit SecF